MGWGRIRPCCQLHIKGVPGVLVGCWLLGAGEYIWHCSNIPISGSLLVLPTGQAFLGNAGDASLSLQLKGMKPIA